MGTAFKKQTTRALPKGAETATKNGIRVARWRNRGKLRTAPLTVGEDGTERILTESATYYAKYRDGAGVVRTVATGCRDELAARQVLADLVRKAELVRSGMLTNEEATAAGHTSRPIVEHIDAFDEALRAKGTTKTHQKDTVRYLKRLTNECGFATLANLKRDALERWLAARVGDGVSARTRNAHRNALVTFCNWCVATSRLLTNPFDQVPKANEKADPKRQRRSMTEDELRYLLAVARERPLQEALTVRKGKRKGEMYAEVREGVRERLERLGRERALIYKTLVLTGLRKNELATLTVGQLHLDTEVPFAELDAADEKNREGNEIPLRGDLAADIRRWLAEKLSCSRQDALKAGEPNPVCLPSQTLVFRVPGQLIRILDRDLKRAGILKVDHRGRSLDVHALRHTFGTLLSKGGVMPRTAQAAMRHSDIKLTMNVYTDPALLDVHGALDVLSTLPLNECGHVERATRTNDAPKPASKPVAPAVAPTRCIRGQSESIGDKVIEPTNDAAALVS
jgi:integrase